MIDILRLDKNTVAFHTLKVERLVTSPDVAKWCRMPYHGHKRGCPNYGRPGCPPDAISIVDLLDTEQPIYLVYAFFDLDGHARWMKGTHPGWSDRQCRNVLYWQQTVRAELRRTARDAMRKLDCDEVTFCPEGLGVNVFVTARLAGLKMDKTKRIRVDHHIALIGHSMRGRLMREAMGK